VLASRFRRVMRVAVGDGAVMLVLSYNSKQRFAIFRHEMPVRKFFHRWNLLCEVNYEIV
jgi:hypothetical protein